MGFSLFAHKNAFVGSLSPFSSNIVCVFSFLKMPTMDGLEATRRLRSMGYTDLPIFGLTASVARSDYKELGFNDWIAKPVPMKDLRAKLSRVKVS